MKYAGIGARKTPMPVLQRMELLGTLLAARGIELRSGKAKGADTAFEVGARRVNGPMTLRVMSRHEPWLAHAAKYHPNWEACDFDTQALHARNSGIVMGDKLNDPVNFIVCWTNGGGAVGGTGQALRIAADIGIPIFNLWFDDAETRLWEFLG